MEKVRIFSEVMGFTVNASPQSVCVGFVYPLFDWEHVQEEVQQVMPDAALLPGSLQYAVDHRQVVFNGFSVTYADMLQNWIVLSNGSIEVTIQA